jgi:hypothetical protein
MDPTLPNVADYVEAPSGTHYRVGTPAALVEVLERARVGQFRVSILYTWDDVPERGRVGRSLGPTLKVPLLVHNTRSRGGGEIHTPLVREVRTAAGGRLLYPVVE